MTLPLTAQETRYIYDSLGRLIGVVDAQGRVSVYDYDEVGNPRAIRRPEAAGPVGITFVNPGIGIAGTDVDIFGVGFGAVPSENQVLFNAVPGIVLSASATHLVTRVPPGAMTGIITVTTPVGSAPSPDAFKVPIITIRPVQAVVGFGKTRQFAAAVTESGDQRVKWSVNGVTGGNQAVGTIDVTGLYTAPLEMSIPTTVQVQARSVSFAGLLGTADVSIVPPSTSVFATPSDVRVIRPAIGEAGGLSSNLMVAAPASLWMVRPGIGEPGGLGVNVTVGAPSPVWVVRPGIGDPGGLMPNITIGSPFFLSVVRPGVVVDDPPGAGPNVTVAAPAAIAVVRPGVGGVTGDVPNVTVAQPSDVRVKRQ